MFRLNASVIIRAKDDDLSIPLKHWQGFPSLSWYQRTVFFDIMWYILLAWILQRIDRIQGLIGSGTLPSILFVEIVLWNEPESKASKQDCIPFCIGAMQTNVVKATPFKRNVLLLTGSKQTGEAHLPLKCVCTKCKWSNPCFVCSISLLESHFVSPHLSKVHPHWGRMSLHLIWRVAGATGGLGKPWPSVERVY